MTDNILHATSRRVTRVHTLTQDGEPYLGDVTHFFVTEDGWEEFTTTMMKTHAPYNTLDEEEERLAHKTSAITSWSEAYKSN